MKFNLFTYRTIGLSEEQTIIVSRRREKYFHFESSSLWFAYVVPLSVQFFSFVSLYSISFKRKQI